MIFWKILRLFTITVHIIDEIPHLEFIYNIIMRLTESNREGYWDI